MLFVIAILSFIGLASCQLLPSDDNVVVIIGGSDYSTATEFDITKTVEIFGCSGHDSILVESFPIATQLGSAVYIPEEDVILHCGGEECILDDCIVSYKCYKWDGQGEWLLAKPLATQRERPLLALGPDLDEPGNDDLTLIVMGWQEQSDVFSPELGYWLPYKFLPEFGLQTSGCLLQYENYVYFIAPIDQNLYELDLNTWSMTSLAGSDSEFNSCVMTKKADGDRGDEK